MINKMSRVNFTFAFDVPDEFVIAWGVWPSQRTSRLRKKGEPFRHSRPPLENSFLIVIIIVVVAV
jgi:hypothetical protein